MKIAELYFIFFFSGIQKLLRKQCEGTYFNLGIEALIHEPQSCIGPQICIGNTFLSFKNWK